MDLAQLTADLDALRERATGAAVGRARHGGARRARARGPGQEGRPDRDPARHRRAARPRTGRRSARSRTRSASAVEGALAEARTTLGGAELAARLAAEAVDVTTPGRPIRRGSLHPIVETAREIAEVFAQFGFVVYEGPEIEDDVTNFQMLNIPPDHPARDLWDTLYLDVDGPPAAHAHEPGPDPGHAPGAAADPRAAARALLPLRGGRRQPRQRVLPGRGPDGRRGHLDGRPQGPARPVRPRDVRRGPRDAVPARLLPVHRAVASRSTSCASSATARSARPARGRAG